MITRPLAIRLSPHAAGLALCALLVLVFAVAAVLLSALVAQEQFGVVALLLAASIGGVLVARWRWGVLALFVFVPVEGFVANFLYPEIWPLLLKDGVVLCVYTGFALRSTLAQWRQNVIPSSAITATLVGFTAVALGQLLNPALPNVLVGLVGLRNWFFYIPLLVIGYHYMRSFTDIRRILWLLVLPSLVPSIVALYQYFAGSDVFLRLSPGFSRALYPTPSYAGGQFIRAFSTFASPGLFGGYLFATLSFALVLLKVRSGRGTAMIIAAVALLNIAALVVSGSRSPILTVALFAVAFLGPRATSVRQLAVVGAFLGALFWIVPQQLGGALADRTADTFNTHEAVQRFVGLFASRVVDAFKLAPLGSGPGTASVAARHVMGGRLPMEIVESYYVKLQYELGIVGVLVFLLFTGLCLREQWHMARTLRTPHVAWVGYGLFLFSAAILLNSVTGMPLDSPPLNVYFWFLFGAAMKLPSLERDAGGAAAAL